nr:energy transducer TonB [Vibrio sp. JPW-9-11-11]
MAAHAALLLVTQQPQAFAMPAGTESSAVSINFTTLPQANPAKNEPEIEPQPTPPKATKPRTERPVKTAKPVEKKPKQTKVEKKVKPVQKVARQRVADKPDTSTKQPQSKVNNITAEAPTTPPQQPAQKANSGVSAEPVLITRPSFLSRPSAPKYPRLARKRGIEGVALYEVWLDEEGKQIKQVLISSSGATLLDKSALDAIKQWKFSPHSIDGQKMAHRVQIPIRFKLD